MFETLQICSRSERESVEELRSVSLLFIFPVVQAPTKMRPLRAETISVADSPVTLV
jgi:hypothetical protein